MLNAFLLRNLKMFEMIGVIMRISSFTVVSFMEKDSPFLFVWLFNTTDAILLTWCSVLKKDRAYTVLNAFWIIIGIIGIYKTI